MLMLFLEFELIMTKVKTNRPDLFGVLIAAPLSIGVYVFFAVGFGVW